MKGYGPKIMHSQSIDFIEKKIKVEIKIEDSLENSEIISDQTSNTDILPSTDFIEKKTKVEIKVEDPLESSEIISVQTSNNDMMPSTNSRAVRWVLKRGGARLGW